MPELDKALERLYFELEGGHSRETPETRLFTAISAMTRLHLTVREVVVELLLGTFANADEVWALEFSQSDAQEVSFTGWIDSSGDRHSDPRLDPNVAISDEGAQTWDRVDSVVAHLRPTDCSLPPFVPGTRSSSALLPIVRADLGQDL